MAKKLSYERYAWFHGRVKAGAFPNSVRLAEGRLSLDRRAGMARGPEVSVGKDGSLRLRVPVSGFVEVAREILKYGAAVEVLEPKELRDTIREEIRKMGTLYR